MKNPSWCLYLSYLFCLTAPLLAPLLFFEYKNMHNAVQHKNVNKYTKSYDEAIFIVFLCILLSCITIFMIAGLLITMR